MVKLFVDDDDTDVDYENDDKLFTHIHKHTQSHASGYYLKRF